MARSKGNLDGPEKGRLKTKGTEKEDLKAPAMEVEDMETQLAGQDMDRNCRLWKCAGGVHSEECTL